MFIIILSILFFAFAILITIYSKRIVGAAGEYWVKKELKMLPREYLTLNDVMVKTNNKTSQIDHIIVSKYGVFVIETKQYNGVLIGNDYDKKWEFKAGNKVLYINNPVHQNYGHVQALKEVLRLNEEKFIPIVCISSNAKINIKSDKVVSINSLIKKIREYNVEILPEYKDIYKTLEFLNVTSKDARESHVNNKKEQIKEKEQNTQHKCPKCGGNLITRKGKYGEFIGCSNYPKCKFTKQIL